MARKKKPHLEKVEITAIGAEGKAIGRVDDKVVFVPMLLPGDLVDVQVTKKRKNFLEGYVTKFHAYSDLRQEAKCQHFGVCGGCKWQHLPYNEQLKTKQQQVLDVFSRIGKFEFPEHKPILKSKKQYYYRNKLEFTFSSSRWLTKDEIGQDIELTDRFALGFHIPGKFDKILDIETCYLQSEASNRIRNSIKKYAVENNLSFHNLRSHQGLLRTLVIRTTSIGELMVVLNFYYDSKDEIRSLMAFVKDSFPDITSLMYLINPKPHDSFGDIEVKLFSGQGYIIENLGYLKFRIGPKSFYQTNTEQALILYKTAYEFANLSGNEVVYDLYTGTGTIANFVAKSAKTVIGLEYVQESIIDAKLNSQLNEITNTSFFAGDMKDILNDEFISENGKPDVIITDPPRAGMHTNVVNQILKIAPQKIVYISCNPATQARDISLMTEQYYVSKVQPIDMFPQTHHVENVVLLCRQP